MINKVSQFWRTADDDVDEFDVARYLKHQGMTNDRITSSQGYKQIVDNALKDKPLSLGGGKKQRNRKSRNAPDTVSGKALTYLTTTIRPIMQIQQWDTRIKEDDIIKKLKDENIIKDKT